MRSESLLNIVRVILLLLPVRFAADCHAETYTLAMMNAEKALEQGQYALALTDLDRALERAHTSAERTTTTGTYGLVQYQLGHYDLAKKRLQEALSSDGETSEQKTRWLATLARIHMLQKQPLEADRLYRQALQLIPQSSLQKLAIELGLAELVPSEARLRRLQDIYSRLVKLPSRPERNGYLIRLANQAHEQGRSGLPLAYGALTTAGAASLQQPRLHAEALHDLAQLYEDEHRWEDARRLNREAITAATKAEARDLLLELEWREGRLAHQADKNNDAIVAYQHAVDHIEAIRHDIPLDYQDGRSSFRATLEPVYLQLADLLLQRAAKVPAPDRVIDLRHAREIVELLKKSELEDYLGGRCAVQTAKQVLVEAVAPGTAVLYPVILPDRLVLLVSLGTEIRQFTAAVSGPTISNKARQFASELRIRGKDSIKLGTEFNAWLIAAIEPWLHEQKVQTLVVVPDGPLRLFPITALHDGQRYLVEKFALVVSPGLSLLEPTSHGAAAQRTLLAGLSEPGPVVDRLPVSFLAGLAVPASVRGVELARTRALPQSVHPAADKALVRGAAAPNLDREQIRDALRLPGVESELAGLRSQLSNTMLLNEAFTTAGFERELLSSRYGVVHIASHWVLGPTAASSFIMAHDDILNLDHIESLLKSGKLRNSPVELLTLSACQTAEGDDRAPLGLSGIAIKARVRSALGTLWPVDDAASANLMQGFYQAMSKADTNRAAALQQAQLRLLRSSTFQHPYYWAPFVLVGSWL